MGRNKKKGEGPAVSSQTLEVAAQLAAALKASGVSAAFYSIRRRTPGQNVWPWFRRNVGFDTVPNIVEYCYAEGGRDSDYRVEVHNSAGDPIPGEDGKPLGPIIIAAMDDAAGGSGAGQFSPELAESRKSLAEQKEANRLKREKLEIDRETARLTALEATLYGEGAPEEEAEEKSSDWWDRSWGPPPWAMRLMQPQTPSMDKIITAIGAAVGALAPLIAPKREDTTEVLLKLVSAMKGDSKDPTKAVFDLLGPFIQQIGSIQSEAAKTALASIADADSSFRERMIDFLIAKGEPDDVVSKWERVLGVAERSIDRIGGSILMRTLGRGSIMDPKKKTPDTVAVPKLSGSKPAQLPVGQKPALAAPGTATPPTANVPAPNPATTAPQNGVQPQPDAAAQPAPEPDKRAERKAEMVQQRVSLILAALTEEMDVDSDPESIADILRQNQYGLLPRKLRAKLESMAENGLPPAKVAEVYEVLRLHAAEAVDEQLADVANDTSGERKDWLAEFWAALLEPDEEGGGPQGEGEGEGEGGDDGEPEPASGEPVEAQQP